MSIKFLIVAIAIAASPTFLHAQESTGFAMSGAGTTSCGKYIEHGEESSDLFVSWAQGFLSGANIAAHVYAKKEMVLLPDSASIKAYLDKFCRDNPLDSPSQGVIFLYRELRSRPINSHSERSNNSFKTKPLRSSA